MPDSVSVRWAMLGVMLAMLLSMLDNNIVGTSMPTIVRDLGGASHLSWVVIAYTLTTAVSTPVWGKLGDLYSRKRVFLISIGVFLAGSVLSGAARNMGELIGFRVVQGLGAGGLGGLAFALIGSLVPPRERGRYQGMTAAVMALGTIGGPLVGGLVTGHLGWRWAFYLNLPLGLVALVWCLLMLPADRPADRARVRIDWPGIALLTLTISSVVLATTWGGVQYAWGSWQVVGLLVVSVVAGAAFVLVQRRVPEPVLPLRIFAHRNFGLASVMMFALGAVMFGASLYLPLFQQTVQHTSVTSSGLLLLPLMAPVVVVSQIGGRVMSRTGRYKVFPVLGGAFLTVGTLLLSTMDTHTSRAAASLFMVLTGVGMGFFTQMVLTIAQNSVEMKDLGVASASGNLFRTIGASVGLAVFGSLFNSAAGHGGSAASVVSATHHIFLVAAGVSAVALLAALSITETPLRSKPRTPQVGAARAVPRAPR
ncbi:MULTISPECIES: MDR family MFS transporter [unclassified Streptomyces]|uniref:MDR family MFS transporter n=1 Tax=unclassified Streptomyces TaxID=2593676 RepID=UPI000DBA47FA|nr:MULTISPECIES: MDR family MFS transporter [unclassified Streptomyces]MYT68624.1 DHA2 family efflux MFS transporter permease subunit [Streptomyces sp. SID8367]RAJ86296.1 EmrB/QacA subfamily drug resistance transporter [Streptomyces sp. PsTaAH-137]